MAEKLSQELEFANTFLKQETEALSLAKRNMTSIAGGYSNDQYNAVIASRETSVDNAQKLVDKANLAIVSYQSSMDTIVIEYDRAKETYSADRTAGSAKWKYAKTILAYIDALMANYKIVAPKSNDGWHPPNRHLYEEDVSNVDKILALYAEFTSIAVTANF